MKILTVVGARPQFIKAAPISKALRSAGHAELILHTGQHYDYRMSQVFFDKLGLPSADINLDVGSGSHGEQTAQMLSGIEKVLLTEKPDCVLVYGDTNSTLAGSLAAIKLQIPLAHVEAGLRSYNRTMPEEHNRVITDHCADLLFCPTSTAVDNLCKEGITQGVHLVGDPMYDAVLMFMDTARHRSTILQDLALQKGSYLLATVHRAYNTDDPQTLQVLLEALVSAEAKVVFPVHPRTRQKLKDYGLLTHLANAPNLILIEPVDYLDMLMLEENARIILTDSGGVQKEAFFFGVPCLTLRPETEWVETVESGWNLLVGFDRDKISSGLKHSFPLAAERSNLFGDGRSAADIVHILGNYL